MFILASKHRAIVAEKEAIIAELQRQVDISVGQTQSALALLERSQAAHNSLILRVAEFADRALPPPRVKDVKQPRSVDEADAGVAKKLRLQGKA